MRSTTRPSTFKRVLGGLFYALFLGAVFAGATLYGWLGKSKVAKELLSESLPWNHPKPADEIFNKNEVTILLLGCDVDLSPGGKKVLNQQARSDMMLVAKLDFKHNGITGISIPRDTLYRMPGYKEHKINAYHAIGGDKLSQKAVEGLLNIKVDRVVAIDYEAFQKLVDLIGGVEVYIDKRMKYDDKAGGLHIDFQPGKRVLTGYDAMCYVRFRHGAHGTSDTDFVREDRQKRLLMAFKNRVIQRWDKLPEVIEESQQVMSNALSSTELVALTHFARGLSQNDIRMGQLPVIEGPGYSLRVDESKLQRTLKSYNFAGRPGDFSRVSLRR